MALDRPDGPAPQRSSRVPRRKKRPLRRFVLMNALPLAAFAALAVLWFQGRIPLEKLPPGTDENLVAALVCIAALFVVASLSLPVTHAVVKHSHDEFHRRKDVITGKEEGSRLGALASSPLLMAAYVIAWPLRLVLILLSLSILAVTVVFLVRLIEPTFLQAWIDRVLEWRRG